MKFDQPEEHISLSIACAFDLNQPYDGLRPAFWVGDLGGDHDLEWFLGQRPGLDEMAREGDRAVACLPPDDEEEGCFAITVNHGFLVIVGLTGPEATEQLAQETLDRYDRPCTKACWADGDAGRHRLRAARAEHSQRGVRPGER